MLWDWEFCLSNGWDDINADWFWLRFHRDVFVAISQALREEDGIDLVSVGRKLLELHPRSAMELASLTDATPSAANFQTHLAVVRDAYQRRQLLKACHQASEERSAPDMRSRLDDAIQQYDRKGGGGNVVTPADIMPRVLRQVSPAGEGRKDAYVETGIDEIDELLGGGLGVGQMAVLAARPSMGKTALALDIALSVAGGGDGVAIFSLETSADELVKNWLAHESGVNSYRLRRGNYSDPDAHDAIRRAATAISLLPIYIEDSSDPGIGDIMATSRRLAYRNSVKLVIIDYLQLVGSGEDTRSREREVALMSRQCKRLAKALHAPVLVISQLNRAVDAPGRKDKRPGLSDLRESGAIEQDADVVMFLYRQGFYDKKLQVEERREGISKTELIVAKQRHGPIGTVLLRFNMRCGDFEPWYEEEDEQEPEKGGLDHSQPPEQDTLPF